MSEFCLDCFNEFFLQNLTEEDVELETAFCTYCKQAKPCVMHLKKRGVFENFNRKMEEKSSHLK